MEGKVIQIERGRLEKVNRFSQNSKCVQDLKLEKFRSFVWGWSREGCSHVAIGSFLLQGGSGRKKTPCKGGATEDEARPWLWPHPL